MKWWGCWLLFFIPSLGFGQPLSVVAKYRGKTLWAVTLQISEGKCNLKNQLNSKPIRIESADCAYLQKFFSNIFFIKKSYLPIDEPVFTFTRGSQKFQVAYHPLEVCEIQNSGKLNCRKQVVTAAQRILHFLRVKMS